MLEQIAALGSFQTVIFVILAMIIAVIGLYVLCLMLWIVVLYGIYYLIEKTALSLGILFVGACLGMWWLLA